MLRRLHFFAACFLFVAFRCPAIETVQIGKLTDLKTLENRLEAVIPAAGRDDLAFSVRGLYIDRWDGLETEALAGGFELKHPRNDSLYGGAGPIRFSGLPRMLADPFGRSLPSGNRQRPAAFTLDGGAAASKQPAAAISLGTNRLLPFWAQAAAITESTGMNSALIGFGIGEIGYRAARLETFFGRANLTAREADTWFSAEPPLPERKQQLDAFAFTADIDTSQWFLCGALSETESQGRGGFLKGGGDFTAGPFRFILAADGATPYFVDRRGELTRAEYRTAADVRYAAGTGGTLFLRGETATEFHPEGLKTARVAVRFRFPSRSTSMILRPIEVSGDALRAHGPGTDATARLGAETRADLGRVNADVRTAITVDDRAHPEKTELEAKATFPFGPSRVSFSAGVETSEEKDAGWSMNITAATPILGGIVRIELGTDAPTTWERLSGARPSSSALGPWTFSVSWRFRQRFQTRPLSVE